MVPEARGIEGAFGLLAITLGTAILAGLLLHRVRQSLLVGYFLCGLVIGPGGLGVIKDPAAIRALSEVGVVLLMFTIGIEFSLSEMKQLRALVLRAGSVQMGVATLLLGGFAYACFGVSPAAAALIGFIGAHSSTAIMLKTFQEADAGGGSAARGSVSVSVFQDIAAIVLMAALPTLIGAAALPVWQAVPLALVKGAAFVGLGWVLGKYAVPFVLAGITRTQSRELFTLTVLSLCAGIAWLGDFFGLSLALGAFAAGLIVSETVYSHRILSDILPFKDIFLTLFFISVGLLVDVPFVIAHWPVLVAATAAVLALKTAAGLAAAVAAGFPARPAVQAGLGLASVGEFGFVLLGAVHALGALDPEHYQACLAIITLSMAATPLLYRLNRPLGRLAEMVPWLATRHVPKSAGMPDRLRSLDRHALICGYGTVGMTLNETLHNLGVPTLVIELNAQTVHRLVTEGQPCLFADVSRDDTFDLAGVERASVLAVTIPHFEAACAAVKAARARNPKLFVICRARYPSQAQPLRDLGVSAVINEEAETSFAVIRSALEQLDRPREEIDATERELRYRFGAER